MNDFSHPAIGAALSAAATLLGTEVVFIGGLSEETFTLERVHGGDRWPGLTDQDSCPRTDSLCHQMLAGAPEATADAGNDPGYLPSPQQQRLGIKTYVGVPIQDQQGRLIGTLCGVDRTPLVVDELRVSVLRAIARIIAAQAADDGGSDVTDHPRPTAAGVAASDVVIRRTAVGWHVDGADLEDLTTAMVLADLVAADLPAPPRPPKTAEPADETERLRVAVRQLEHALTARIAIEQAIGTLAERTGLRPRDAFELLRRSARAGGRRVYDLARDVVRSATDADIALPAGLRPR